MVILFSSDIFITASHAFFLSKDRINKIKDSFCALELLLGNKAETTETQNVKIQIHIWKVSI